MPLTDTAIRNAKPGEKPVKMFDERGLFLMVTPAGGKWWRLRYKFDSKEKLLSLGVYPDVGLKEARERREAARKLCIPWTRSAEAYERGSGECRPSSDGLRHQDRDNRAWLQSDGADNPE